MHNERPSVNLVRREARQNGELAKGEVVRRRVDDRRRPARPRVEGAVAVEEVAERVLFARATLVDVETTRVVCVAGTVLAPRVHAREHEHEGLRRDAAGVVRGDQADGAAHLGERAVLLLIVVVGHEAGRAKRLEGEVVGSGAALAAASFGRRAGEAGQQRGQGQGHRNMIRRASPP